MTKRALLFCIVLCTIVAAAAENADTLKQADRQFCADTRAQGLEGWMKWWASDGYVGNDPTVQGTAKLRDFYQGLFARKNLDFRWEPSAGELFASGTMGYTSGSATMSFVSDKGEQVVRESQYLTVWRKQSDGSWKVWADFGAPKPKK